jgi:phage N-6-adenine-methyltransferase
MVQRGDGYYTAHSGYYEWYTPSWVVEKCRMVMGGIDLDPFSCQDANRIVAAKHFYDKNHDALVGDWMSVDTMFANPPYASGLIGKCVDKIVEQYVKGNFQLGCVLVNNASDTSWFHELIAFSTHMVIFQKRISFINPLVDVQKPNTRGQVLFLMNKHDKYTSCQSMYAQLHEQFCDNGFVCRLYDCDCDNNH